MKFTVHFNQRHLSSPNLASNIVAKSLLQVFQRKNIYLHVLVRCTGLRIFLTVQKLKLCNLLPVKLFEAIIVRNIMLQVLCSPKNKQFDKNVET